MLVENQFYHIYNRGNNSEDIFSDEENYIFFLSKFQYFLKDFINVYSYCLMPNHFHFLVKIKPDSSNLAKNNSDKMTLTEKAFRDFFISYAKSFNKSQNRTGSLFQYKFKRKLIDKEAYLKNIVAYIHLNPVRAKLADKAEDWEYSSISHLVKYKKSLIDLCSDEVLSWFGGIENFIDFHKMYSDIQTERDYLFK